MNISETVDCLRHNGLTYCGRPGKLEVVQRMVEHVEAERVPGLFLEAGVAMGGSASVIAKAKRPDRRLRLYDVFRMLPPPSENDEPKAHDAFKYFLSGKVNGVVDRNYVDNAGDLLAFSKLTMQKVGIDVDAANVEFIKAVDAWLAADSRFGIVHADWTVAVRRLPQTA